MKNHKKNIKNKSGGRPRGSSIRLVMIISYILISLISICSIAFLTYSKTSSSMTTKAGKLTTAINDQIRLSVNDQLKNIEDICSLVFSDAQTYGYYDSDESITDYDKIQIKSSIESVLLTNSLMTNFGDFCIVYDNNKSVGKLASSTSSLLGSDTIYERAAGFISRKTTDDGWVAGVDGYYTRLFYVKRINEHAVLLASIYTADLEALMEISDEMQGMEINIVDNENKVIFSTADIKSGEKLESGLCERMSDRIHSAFIYGDNLVTLNTLNDDWRIVSTISTDKILEEVYEIRNFTIIIAAVFVVVAIIIGIIFAEFITKPIHKLVQVMKKAETGDLTVKADFKSFGDLKLLNKSFDNMLAQICLLVADTEYVADKIADEVTTIHEIAQNSQNISENISVAIEDIAEGSAVQLDRSQVSFESLEKLAQNISDTIHYMDDVRDSSENTRKIGNASISQISELQEKTKASSEALDKIQSTFATLIDEVDNIEEVLSLILNISDETSLLAMNAGIEAARAGEAGKGFAVVAGEVSKLAQQTETSTNSINAVIAKIRTYVDSTTKILRDSMTIFSEQSTMVEQMIISFDEIVKATNMINQKIEEVQRTTDIMNSLKENSIHATRNILEIAKNSSANTEEVASVTIEELEVSRTLSKKAALLSEQAGRLHDALKQFTINSEDIRRN